MGRQFHNPVPTLGKWGNFNSHLQPSHNCLPKLGYNVVTTLSQQWPAGNMPIRETRSVGLPAVLPLASFKDFHNKLFPSVGEFVCSPTLVLPHIILGIQVCLIMGLQTFFFLWGHFSSSYVSKFTQKSIP